MNKPTTRDVHAALARRYPMPKWVLVSEAPSQNIGGGRCDAMAFGVWGSSQNQIIGHEVKVSRSDWLKELDNPDKSDVFIQYCDRWYIVALPKIVKPEELRSTWGLMELAGSGLKIRRQAESRIGEPIPRNMMSAILRRVAQDANADEIDIAVAAQREACERTYEYRQERLIKENERLEKLIKDFEQTSGVNIGGWNGAAKIGAAVRAVMEVPDGKQLQMRRIAEQYEILAKTASDAADELQTIANNEQTKLTA